MALDCRGVNAICMVELVDVERRRQRSHRLEERQQLQDHLPSHLHGEPEKKRRSFSPFKE
jgi:hypothetical protein